MSSRLAVFELPLACAAASSVSAESGDRQRQDNPRRLTLGPVWLLTHVLA